MDTLLDHDAARALRRIGFRPALLAGAGDAPPGASLLRVVELQRDRLTLHDGCREHAARALPALQQALRLDDDTLAVGDWVWAARNALGECWVGARVAPLNRLARRDVHGRRQVLVANVDTALLVMGLDADFNPRRLERYLALAHAAGVAALVVLTKADLCADAAARLASLRPLLRAGTTALALDARDASARDVLAPWLGEGQTLVVLGSSGAGKSTLVNTLAGAAQPSAPVRARDGRGCHTTTVRSLHRCGAGACIIDTPGLRTLRLDTDGDGLAAAFDDIARWAAHCRFRDCRHDGEPGCAVRDAVGAERLRNYRKLERELRRDALDARERRQQVALWQARARAAAARLKDKRGAR